MPSRRAALCGLVAVATGGCLSTIGAPNEPTSSGGSTTRSTTTGTTTAGTTTPTATASTTPTSSDPEPVRGEADPVSVERKVTAEKYEYVPSNDTVRYPAAKSRGTVVRYGYQPFEDWVEVRTATYAMNVLPDRFEAELGTSENLSIAMTAPTESLPFRVSVYLTTRLDRDGEVISEPSVTKPDVVAVTPRTFEATVQFSDHEDTGALPVYVQESTVQNA